MADFADIFEKNLDDQSTKINDQFQAFAANSGWERQIANKISIDKGFFNIPSEVKTQVEDLEYGSIGNPANAALRKFRPRISQNIEEAIVDALMQTLKEEAKEVFG